MNFRIKDQREFLAGLMFFAIGTGWGWASLQFPIGQATDMGSGYFPLCVSIVLAILGLSSMIRATRVGAHDGSLCWDVAPLIFVSCGILLFAALIERSGLVPATAALVIVASYKRIWQRPVETVVLAAVTAAFVAILFVYILQLDIGLFGT